MSTIVERVDRGVELLNHFVPNWRGKVDPACLDLSDTCGCVLGQLVSYAEPEYNYGNYYRVVEDGRAGRGGIIEEPNRDLLGFVLSEQQAIEHGFHANYNPNYNTHFEDGPIDYNQYLQDDWEMLSDEWKRRLDG